MKNIEKLDFILGILYNHNDLISSEDLLLKVNDKITEQITKHDLRKTINHFVNLNYIKKTIIENKNNSKTKPPYACEITYLGFLFFENGGFKKENKILRQRNIWIVAKTIAAVANALIIIFISIWAIIESKKDSEVETLKNEIELLKKDVNKLVFINKIK